MKNKAINALLEMDMPANLIGFHYIVNAMCLIDEDKSYICGRTGELYAAVAEQNNTTAARVERAIRNAFSCVLRNETSAVDKYLSRKNTANSELLSLFYLRLTQEG